MSRYDGYTEPLEVLVEILRELKKMNELVTPQETPAMKEVASVQRTRKAPVKRKARKTS